MEGDKDNKTALRSMMERCQQHLASGTAARDYLAANGVHDPRVINAYRIGAGSPHLQMEFSAAEKRQLTALGLISGRSINELDGGILLPTFDPREPQQPVGFIKMSFAQNKHHFATAPAGIAITPAVATASKIVLIDTPLLGLRLAQAGVAAGIVEDPAVISPLTEWLNKRDVVLASYKTPGLKALKGALGGTIENVRTVMIQPELRRTDADGLALLGVDQGRLAIVPPKLVSKIAAYAQDRLQAGHGVDLLRRLHADTPEFISVYGIGYLPTGFSDVLDDQTRQMLSGVALEDSVVIPAMDLQGVPVDLLIIRMVGGAIQANGLQPFPMGLIAPKIASAFDELAIVDDIAKTAGVFGAGERNVLLLRGELDAQINAARLRHAGVRWARLQVSGDAGQIAHHLRVAGMNVVDVEVSATADTPPSTGPVRALALVPITPADVTLVSHDLKAETAVFAAGDLKYEVEVSIDPSTRLQVRLTGDGKVTLDRFDLASAAQRHRFAMSAALRTTIHYEAIEQHLIVILDRVAELQASLVNPDRKPVSRPEIPLAEKQEALEFLRRPDLIDALASDLEAIGWIGEEINKRLLLLTAISRKLPAPLSAVTRAPSGSGKSTGVETIAAVTPPEDVLHVSRLTESALYYHDRDALRSRLLVIDEADVLTPEVLVAIRVLQTRGSLTQNYTQRDPSTGATRTQFIECRGPIAVLMSTTKNMDEQNLSRCLDLGVDDSSEQTQRILEAQRRLRADPNAQNRRGEILRRHHTIQRVLECRPVLIPFADRIDFPAHSLKARRAQPHFLNLLEACALLHQHQRLRHQNDAGVEMIVADERDFEIVAPIAAKVLLGESDGLSGDTHDLLSAIKSAGLEQFTINDVKALRPGWGRYKMVTAVEELARLQYLVSPVRGRGKLRSYVVVAAAAAERAPMIRLLPKGQSIVVEDKLQKGVSNNFTPSTATG